MCGIAGIVGKAAGAKHSTTVQSMTDAIAHRGPDGAGLQSFENCVLGHRRLSIVDLTTGQQPMMLNQHISIVFNGEIYGYQELRKRIKYDWQTTSDTEVVMALYEQHKNIRMLKQLNGMFAFAIWDEKEQQLFAARDRFGEKPFYFTTATSGEFIFASELKAIVASKQVTLELDKDSLAHYLTHLYVAPNKTIYKNVHVLPAGHCLTLKNGNIIIEKYWEIPKINNTITFEDAKDEVLRLLTESVKKQLVADVPVGCFLSGGLDSSVVTALAALNSTSKITALSFAFNDSDNELDYSSLLAEQYKLHNPMIFAEAIVVADFIDQMHDIYDEPFADSSNIATFVISKKAAKDFKVVLTGDGGDELFGGYTNWYRSLYNFEHPTGIKQRVKNWVKKLNNSKYRTNNMLNMHVGQNSYFTATEISALIGETKILRIIDDIDIVNDLNGVMQMDVYDYMPGDILVKTDRAAMAAGLELRAPFLDVPFAEFCLSLPYQFKIDKTDDKIILKKAVGHLLPEKILTRSKRGFGAPIQDWMQQPKTAALVKTIINNPNAKIYSFVNAAAAKKHLANNDYKAWAILNLAIWMEKHL